MTSRTPDFLHCFAQHPTQALIANLTTRLESITLAGQPVPLSVNDGAVLGNCYICNPLTAYSDYAIEETRLFSQNVVLRSVLTGLIRGASPLLRATGLDRAVHVNNWLFSTNPAPKLANQDARDLRDALVARFPSHALILRSLNTYSDRAALDSLSRAGFTLLPSRQIYLFDARKALRLSKDMKNDRALLRRSALTLVEGTTFTPADFQRCAALYGMLYLEKYTALNPQYTAKFLQEMQRIGVLTLQGFRDETGQLVAFGGRFVFGQTLTQPLLGYDTTRPQKEGLYRLVTALAQHHAMEQRLLFNMSAGAAGFKRHRCAVPAIEYSAIYVRHLPLRQRLALSALAKTVSSIGVPLLRHFEL